MEATYRSKGILHVIRVTRNEKSCYGAPTSIVAPINYSCY